MTPPAAEGHFSRATLTDLLCEKFTACRVKSSLHLDSSDAVTWDDGAGHDEAPGPNRSRGFVLRGGWGI